MAQNSIQCSVILDNFSKLSFIIKDFSFSLELCSYFIGQELLWFTTPDPQVRFLLMMVGGEYVNAIYFKKSQYHTV